MWVNNVNGVIGSALGKQWNFSEDPCSGASDWSDSSPYTAETNPENKVICQCSPAPCHVIKIILKNQNLNGFLPAEFANLTSLQVIDLTRNYLNGTIPAAWASLPLTKLALTGNRITGQIPKELGNVITLQELILEDNQIDGSIPPSLGNLKVLSTLRLSGNYISGELPKFLGYLMNMTQFEIDGNPISGSIPSVFGNWTKLNQLSIQGTSLEGPVPVLPQSLIVLRVTDLRGGNGTFPPLMGLKGLKTLVLRNLSLSDSPPDYIGYMGSLEFLDLSFNNFSGTIPSSFERLKGLSFMYLTNNKLTGEIPRWIFTRGQHYDLSYNSFNGSDAPRDCQVGSVNLVSSYSSTDSNMTASCLRRNNPCPGKAKNFELFLNCGGSQMTVGDHEYQADTNQEGASNYYYFSDKWAYSSTGDFSSNEMEPYIATNISVLNMPDPKLYMTARLSPLSLRYYGLCLQNGNYTVMLHFAEIMFTDDQSYSSVGRRIFDVSIQGEKVLTDFNIAKEANGTGRVIIKTFYANVTSNTLEIHFQWAGKGTSSIPHISVYGPLISAILIKANFKPDTGESKLSKGAILGIVTSSCVLIILVSILAWFFLKKDAENNGLALHSGCFTLRQIKNATRNFDPTNKIGEGGFGPVYKGILPNGSMIAVKQLSSTSKQGNREFINEIGMISALKHPNLVKIFGCCTEGKQLLLIYEYMENNSLANALFGHERNRLKLDWQTRRRICVNIAQGLAYLHEESRLKIVHRDIKATNVLLDKDLNAKISDFGLAKLSEEDESHISTRIAGTIGYMAPEYAMRGYLTDKADIYSFGVVMLEIVSGISNTACRLEDSMYLLDWAYAIKEQGNLLELVDKSLGSNYSEEEALQMLNLALTCTNSAPHFRPAMSTVVNILHSKNFEPVSSTKITVSSLNNVAFNGLEKLSDERQIASPSSVEPWRDSTELVPSTREETIWFSATNKQFPDY
ncbi:Non-specific serine/threonine protein kinase protein [Dioscorea alata]|uniref:Non-specific serine/threonine protein kinase protein n=1 Tax=Dioscorea alata TaxID=55571 RepID=A0ACB7UXM7_DIOAL|nr:Non-specific serine/threonine protein kinase protein [Dioscorea alata]